MILTIATGIAAYFFMEFVAWSNHKYVMHGFLWKWHKDHHVNDHKKQLNEIGRKKASEKNDRFFVVYALPAIVLFMVGLELQIYPLVSAAVGITAYGFTYFMIHDVIIHERLNIPFLRNSKNPYIRAIISAHLAHHRPKSANDFNNYGLLIFSKKYFNN